LQKDFDLTSKSLEAASQAPTRIAVREIEKKIQEINKEKNGDESLHSSSIDEGSKKRALERIEGYKKELQDLALQLNAAEKADEPFLKEYNRLSSILGQQRCKIGIHIDYHASTVALSSAREAFQKLEKDHLKMVTSFEVWNARPQEIEELKRKAAAIDPEIAKYSAEISKVEKELPRLQTELSDLQSQFKERSAKIKKLKRDISELKATIEPKQFSLNDHSEETKFNEERTKEKQELDAQYEKCVNAKIEELRKILIPSLEMKATSP
jgi:DNA repair exonuclease SbcCD ATPase subunit